MYNKNSNHIRIYYILQWNLQIRTSAFFFGLIKEKESGYFVLMLKSMHIKVVSNISLTQKAIFKCELPVINII